jgi:hypothetical protein
LRRYTEILNALDPDEIRDRLFALGNAVVLLCHERTRDIEAGRCFCHRHVVAEWLEQTLGITVLELHYPRLDRFAYLQALGIDRPVFCRGRADSESAAFLQHAGGDAAIRRPYVEGVFLSGQRLPPPAQGHELMPPHKFKVGDIVVLKPAMSRFLATTGVFEVLKQLPGSSEPEYRIKSVNEPHERAARESELIKP